MKRKIAMEFNTQHHNVKRNNAIGIIIQYYNTVEYNNLCRDTKERERRSVGEKNNPIMEQIQVNQYKSMHIDIHQKSSGQKQGIS